ncbi:unnamed protein product [Parnassius mnemosyne]|uniref:Mitochondrial cytochrome c oxidase subunit VIc/VIIs domain-containing protein n=1 Tax=Parnassius mnemosyne TaxID=213953 RepID=A0AAV1L6M8_9NEOP
MNPKCPDPNPDPCPQVCQPPPPSQPACLVKPVMRGLHRAQTKRVLTQAILLSILSGAAYYLFVGAPRKQKYKEFYAKGEFEDWADEMARKGLFQAVPRPPRNN